MPTGAANRDKFPWTPEQYEFTLKMWRRGSGSSAIADAINVKFRGTVGVPVSRSAVSGKLSRNKEFRSSAGAGETHRQINGPKRARRKVVRNDVKPTKPTKGPACDAHAEARAPVLVVDTELDALDLDQIRALAPLARDDKVVTVETLETRDCRFPIGDPKHAGFGFCARPKASDTGSYCCAHSRLVGGKAANAWVQRPNALVGVDPRAFRFGGRRKAG